MVVLSLYLLNRAFRPTGFKMAASKSTTVYVTLTQKEKMIKAHKIARQIRPKCNNYAAAMSLAMREVNRPMVIEATTESTWAKFTLIIIAMVMMVVLPATTTTADIVKPAVNEVGYCAQTGVQFIGYQYDLICK